MSAAPGVVARGWLAAAVLLTAILPASLGLLPAGRVLAQGVRVVDAVNVSSDRDEATHDLAGEGMLTGEFEGRKWRSAVGWFSYTLRIYEDTALTLVCHFAEDDGPGETFDILVDGRKPPAPAREVKGSRPREFRLTLPLAETAGRTEVTVTFRARPGARTARLLELRTVQEHLE